MNVIIYLFKICIAYTKYWNMMKKQGCYITDVDYAIDPYAKHMRLDFSSPQSPAGIVDLNNSWKEDNR